MSVLQSSVNWVIQQAHERLGNDYEYGETYSPTDTSLGADCSGVVGWVLQALTQDPATLPVGGDGRWLHTVSTESWAPGSDPGTVGPYGTIAVASLDDIPADAALTINIEHGGGGPYSHTNCVVPLPGSLPYEGVIVESNGSYGSCTNGTGAYTAQDPLWTDHWYLPGPWVEDVPPAGPSDPPPAPSRNSYIVQPGDTLDAIAAQFNVTDEALLAANPQITDANLIYPGQVINIP